MHQRFTHFLCRWSMCDKPVAHWKISNISASHSNYSSGQKVSYVGIHQKNRNNKLSSSTEFLFGRSVCEIAMKVSPRPVFRVLMNSNWKTVLPDDQRINSILNIACKRGIPVEYESLSQLFTISDGRPHQGICVEVGQLPVAPLNDKNLSKVLDEQSTSHAKLMILLYDIQDPVNVGTILRTCYFLGIQNVVLTTKCSPITSVTSKASSGATELMSLYSISNPLNFVMTLKEKGYDVLGTDVADDEESDEDFDYFSAVDCHADMPTLSMPPIVDINEMKLEKPSILILGSEGFGIPINLKETCTKLITINPVFPCTDERMLVLPCLNVSNAAAVIIHRLISTLSYTN